MQVTRIYLYVRQNCCTFAPSYYRGMTETERNLLYGVVSLILPENILDQFDIVKFEEEDIARNDGSYQPFKRNGHTKCQTPCDKEPSSVTRKTPIKFGKEGRCLTLLRPVIPRIFSADRVISSPPELGGEPEGRGGLNNGYFCAISSSERAPVQTTPNPS